MFYLPICFQSIRGETAVMSGVDTLPFLAFFAAGAITSGSLTGKTRYLQPWELISSLLMTAGTALFYKMNVDSSQAWYFGTQVLFGFGGRAWESGPHDRSPGILHAGGCA